MLLEVSKTIGERKVVEPLFDLDDTKILLLWLLIKLLSVLEMNLTPKAKVSLRMLKIQHLGGRFESRFQKVFSEVKK